MTNGLSTTGVGMLPQMYKQEVIANNLANMNTTGFKRDEVYFKEIMQAKMYHQMQVGDSELLPEIDSVYINFQQGPLAETNNELDVGLNGEGFFVVQTPQGQAYTRNGNFNINNEGILVTNEGHPVMGEDGLIELKEASRIQIGQSGQIIIDGKVENKLMAVNFENPEALVKAGHNLFVPGDGNLQEIPVENLKFQQGHLEQSNVQPTRELVDMIQTMRIFDSLQKTMKAHDDTIKKAVNELGRGK